MKGTDLYLAMQDLDDALVERYAEMRPKQTIPMRKLVAACLAGVLLVGGGAVVVDAITYTQAKDFFTENGLSTQGLSREDVRAVYQDITTNSFTYEKTDEVITRSISQAVPGYEIVLDMDDPEKLRLLWESWENGVLASLVIDGEIKEPTGERYQGGIWYEDEMISVYNYEVGYSEIKETVIRKYQDKTLCWESTVPFVARLIKPIGEGTVVVGENMHISGPAEIPREGIHQRIACLDVNGQILWEKALTEGQTVSAGGIDWSVSAGETDWAFANGDETFDIFVRSASWNNGNSLRSICVWRYDLQGKQMSYKVIDIGQDYLSKVFQIGEYYILALSNESREIKTVVMDADGVVQSDAEYQITDKLQRIQDVVVVDNYRYISAYTMLAAEGQDELGQPNAALSEEVKALWEQPDKISKKELIEHIRSHYTAVLLRCDIETGEVQTFYSVPGAIADKLEVSESGELIWYLQSLTQAEMIAAPNTHSGCHIKGTSVIYRCIFDAEGKLREKENTGELATYLW